MRTMEKMEQNLNVQEFVQTIMIKSSKRNASKFQKGFRAPRGKTNFKNAEFLIKIFQIIIACVGLILLHQSTYFINYSAVTDYLMSNIVFGSSIIITNVIIISYISGYKISDLVIRMFSILSSILYLVAGGVTLSFLIIHKDITTESLNEDENEVGQYYMLLSVCILNFINSVLYFVDFILNIRRIIKDINDI